MGQPEADGRTKVEGFTRYGMLAEIRRIYTPGPVKPLRPVPANTAIALANTLKIRCCGRLSPNPSKRCAG